MIPKSIHAPMYIISNRSLWGESVISIIRSHRILNAVVAGDSSIVIDHGVHRSHVGCRSSV